MSTDPRLLEFARRMRREPTPAEELLWRELRNRQMSGFKCRRQHPLGLYILDFYVPHSALVVELDGDSHTTEEGIAHDRVRHSYLESLGLVVLRFWNAQVHDDIESVVETIYAESARRNGMRRARSRAASADEWKRPRA